MTGAGRGLGRGCALELARAGAQGRARRAHGGRAGAGARTRRGTSARRRSGAGGARRATCRRRTDEVAARGHRRAAAARGSCGVLVTAAGTNRPGPARDYPVEDWDLLFDVNVRATFLACRAFGDALLTRGCRERS